MEVQSLNVHVGKCLHQVFFMYSIEVLIYTSNLLEVLNIYILHGRNMDRCLGMFPQES